MNANPLLLPMAAHLLWTLGLYAWLTVVRAPSAWGIGATPDGSNPWATIEPRVSANLTNQFEWPLFFYIACLLLQSQSIDAIQVWLAWIFVGGRVIHSLVQIFSAGVRLRGVVFTLNFAAVLGMWALILTAQT